MATIKGQNLRLFCEDDYAFAAATSCQVHLQMETSESSTKDTNNDWQDTEVTGMSWDCQVDALVIEKPQGDGSAVYLDDIQSYMEQKAELTVYFAMASGNKNRYAGNMLLRGNAIITDMQVVAQNRQNAVLSVKLQGRGELELCTIATPSFGLPVVVKNLTTNDYILFNRNIVELAEDMADSLTITDSNDNVLTVELTSEEWMVKKNNTTLFYLGIDYPNLNRLKIFSINTSSTTVIKSIKYDNA